MASSHRNVGQSSSWSSSSPSPSQPSPASSSRAPDISKCPECAVLIQLAEHSHKTIVAKTERIRRLEQQLTKDEQPGKSSAISHVAVRNQLKEEREKHGRAIASLQLRLRDETDRHKEQIARLETRLEEERQETARLRTRLEDELERAMELESWAREIWDRVQATQRQQAGGYLGLARPLPSLEQEAAGSHDHPELPGSGESELAQQVQVPVPVACSSCPAHLARVQQLESQCRLLREKYFVARGTFHTIVRIRGPAYDPTYFTVADEDEQQRLTVCHPSSSSSPFQGNKTSTFLFDRVFLPDSTKEEVFAEVRPLLSSALDGAHVVFVAYGRSGTGKTTTIRQLLQDVGDAIFGGSSNKSDPITHQTAATAYLSYTELYNDSLVDLIPSPPRVLDTGRPGARTLLVPLSVGATKATVGSTTDLLDTFHRADKKRQTAATEMNSTSSRSHAFLTLLLPSCSPTPVGGGGGSITFADLAGHEKISTRIGSITIVDPAGPGKPSGTGDAQAVEARHINAGLSALNTALRTLASQQKKKKTGLSASSIWCSTGPQLLPRIVGGVFALGGGGGDEDPPKEGGGGGKRLKSKVCLLGTVDLREAAGVVASITTLSDLGEAAGIRGGGGGG